MPNVLKDRVFKEKQTIEEKNPINRIQCLCLLYACLLIQIAEALDEMHYKDGDLISDNNERFYIVRSGCGKLYCTNQDGAVPETQSIVKLLLC